MLKKIKALMNEHVTPTQPKECKGCMWGAWEGTKQFCSKQICVKSVEVMNSEKIKKLVNPKARTSGR